MHKIREQKFSSAIFKAYDIRGVYPDEINEDAAYKTGRAFADYIKLNNRDKQVTILVSSDARESSPSLKESFISGVLDEGARVIDAELTTTPMHYFAVNISGADGGAMITASHNPREFNGIKLSKKGAVPIGEGAGMEEIKNSAMRGIFSAPDETNEKMKDKVLKKSFLNEYIGFFEERFAQLKESKFLLVACLGNGMTSILIKKLFEKFPGIKVKYLHDNLDMTFPNHEADPLKAENLNDVRGIVRELGPGKRANLGVSFDGDGDRVGFVDNRGEIVPGDLITALLADNFSAGDKIIYDVRSSRVVQEEIKDKRMEPIESRVGHAFIKALMRKEDAVFGGEVSGHYYFKDFFYADSAIFAMLSVLEVIQKNNQSLNKILQKLRKYHKTGEINFKVKNKELALDKIISHFANGNASYLDGVKVDFPDWWFNLRLSNTEDLVRLNLEANTNELMEEKKKLISELLTQSG